MSKPRLNRKTWNKIYPAWKANFDAVRTRLQEKGWSSRGIARYERVCKEVRKEQYGR